MQFTTTLVKVNGKLGHYYIKILRAVLKGLAHHRHQCHIAIIRLQILIGALVAQCITLRPVGSALLFSCGHMDCHHRKVSILHCGSLKSIGSHHFAEVNTGHQKLDCHRPPVMRLVNALLTI